MHKYIKKLSALYIILLFLSHFQLRSQSCIAGQIRPDSLWIPCGFSGSVTLNFYPQNGFCAGNHCSTTELAPFLNTGLIGWFPFCSTNPMNDRSTKADHFNTALPSDVFLNSVNNKNDINMLFPDRFGLPSSNSFGLSYFQPTTTGGQGTQFILQNNINPTPNSNKMTLSFWYLIDKGFSFNQNRGLFEMQDVSNNPIMQIWNSRDTSSCSGCHSDTLFIRHQTFNNTVILPYNSFKTNTPWVFVSIIIDASSGIQKASFYLNGQFIKDETINTATHVFGTKYQFGRITSASGWTTTGSMTGNIDDIYFHERALNAYEVSILYKGYRTKWNNVNADSSNSINVTFPNNQSFYTIQLFKGANTTFLSDTVFVRNIRPQPFITPDPVFLCAQSNILFTLRDTINVPTKFAFQSNWGINLLQQPFLSREVYVNGIVKQAKTSVFNPNGNSTFLYVADSVPGVDTLWIREWNIYNQTGCDTISKKVLITKYRLPALPNIKDTIICQFRPTPPIDSFIKKNPLTAKYRIRYYSDSTITDTLIKPILSTNISGVFTFFASQVNDTTGCEGARKRFTYTVLPTPLLTSDTILPSICSGTTATSSFTSNLSNTIFSWTRSINALLSPSTRSGTGNISDVITSSSTASVVATYNITLTNVNGCFSTRTIRDTVLPRPILSNTLKLKNICNGTLYRDTFKSATAGTTFSWTRNLKGTTGTGPASGTSAFIVDNLTNPTVNPIIVSYPVTISARGCISNDSLRVTVNPTPIMTTNPNPTQICSGQNYRDTIKSSTLGATFSWTRNTVGLTPTSGSSASAFINETLTNSGTAKIVAKYVVSMTINSCTKVDTIFLTVNPIPTLSSSITPPAICSGKPFNYAATSATRDSVLTWTKIANANITSKGPNSGSNNIVNDTLLNLTNTLQTQSYVYTIVSNGCSKIDTVKVVVNPTPKLASAKNILASCTGLVTYTPTSTISPILTAFSWSRPSVVGISNGSSSGSNSISESLINTTSSSKIVPYFYTLTANGCSYIDTIFATVNPTASINSPKFPTAICSGQSFNYKATSATSGVVFGWKRIDTSGISPTAIVPFTPTDTISEILTNSNTFITRARYVISLTFGGCTRFDTVFVNINPRPRFNPTPTLKNICNNSVYADTMKSLTAGTSYSWTRILPSGVTGSGNASDTNRIISQTLNNVNTEPQTVIYPTVLTANGCTNLDTFRVRVNPTLVLNSNKNLAPICSGDTVKTTLTSSTNNVTFNWTRPIVSGIIPITKTDTARNIREVLQDTSVNSRTANYIITMSLNGCNNVDTVKITINPQLKLSSTKTPSPICSGTAFNYTPQSATPSVSFAWTRPAVTNITTTASTPGTGIIIDTLKNSTLSNINVNYIYTLTANSCSNNDTISVMVVPPPSSNLISVDTIKACGDSAQITSLVGMTTYLWSNGKTTQNIFVKSTGWYKLTATNATGCTGNDSVFVSIVKANIINNDTAICLGNAVSISADSIGNITFLWSTGSTSSKISVTPNITTKYWVRVSNGSHICTDTMTVTVKPLPKLSGTKTVTANCSGNVTYNAASTVSPTSYVWKRSKVIGIAPDSSNGTSGSINENLVNNTANPITTTYYFTLTANGCSQLDTVTASIIPSPSLSSTKTPTQICSGDTFKYKATSGTLGTTFSWIRMTNVNITPAPSALSNNDTIGERLTNTSTAPTVVRYVINLTANGCTKIDTVSLMVNPTPKLTPAPTLQNICNKGVLNITLNSATTGTNYSWTRNLNGVTGTGASSGSIITINDTLTNATTNPININYPILLTANGCQNNDTIKALINPTPKLNNIPTTAGRCGGNAFTYTATSATTGATFAWTRASIAGITPATNAQSSATISETLNNSTTSPIVVSYIYTTTINSCSGNDTIRDTIYPSPSLSSAKTATICSGTAFNYTATSATAGTGFSWTRPAVTNITTAATPGAGNVITDTLRNTSTAPIIVRYIFTLSANGCSRPDTVEVTVNPRPKLQAPKTTTSNCSGVVSYTGTSATVGTTFAWSRASVPNITPSTQTGSNATINESLTNSTANPITTTYIYTLTANSCSEQDTVTASIIPTPSLSSTKTPTQICSEDTFKYKATTATTGATFSWVRMANVNITPAPSALSNNDTIGEKLTNTSTAPTIVRYVINLTANGCSKVDTVSLTVNPTPRLTPVPTLQNICNKGVLNITLNSATTGTNYNWTRNLNGVTGTGASSGSSSTINDTLTNATTNPININYPILLTANGCQNKDTIKALINPTPKLNNIPTTAGRCGGNAFNFTATSATTGATFAWSRAAITGITPATNAQSSATISESLNNSTTSPIVVSYIYTTTINSCSGNDTIRDTIYPSPSLNSVKTATICSGTAFNYSATSATAGTLFSWTRPAVTGITTTATPGSGNTITDTLRNNTTAPIVVSYIFTLSANGCSRPDTINVTVNPRPKLNSTKTITAACSGLVNYTPTSATTGSSFVWNRNAVTGIIPATNSGIGNISETISDTTPNTIVTRYFFTITANGCSELDTLSVSVNPSPILSSNKNPNAVCSGSLFSYTPSSATPSTTFSWSRAAVSGISNAANTGTSAISETLINTTTNPIIVTYIYTLSANSCSKTDTVRIRINPLPTANITAPRNYICVGDSVLLTADTLPKYTYQWRLNSSSISGANSRFLQVKAIGNYDVVVTDSNGCVRTSSFFNITSKPNPSTKIDTLGPVSVCIGGSIALRADTLAKARFQWFKNGTSLSNDTFRFISATSAGSYSYQVIDSNGCRSISSGTEVFFNTVPTAAASALGSTNFCLGGSATLTANNAPGSTYQWRKNSLNILGENLQTFEATTSGSYSVRVCNGGCCVVSNTIVVNVDTPPTATISPNTTQNVCMGSTVTLNASTGTGYTYQWQVNGIPIAGATNASYTATDSGFYTVNISFGYCTIAPPTVRVNMVPIPPIPFNVFNQVYCQGDTPTPLSASANLGNVLKWYTTPTGGTGTTTAPTQSTLIADTFMYFVVQMNAFNCESPRVPQQVIVNPTPLKPIVNDIFYCNGDTAKALTATLTTGDTLIWYTTRTGGLGSRISPTPSLTTFGKQVFFVSQKTKFGCEGPRDSIIVTFSDTSSTLIRDTICKNQFVTFNNVQINNSGIYRDTFTNFKGCDSFVTLHLHVKDTSVTVIFDTICINHPVLFKGQLRTSTGLYLDTLVNKNGCDSFIFFNLIVNDTPSTNLFDTICKNSFVFFKNQNINTSGIYRDTFISNKGCDSFVTLHLLVNDTSSTDVFDTICVNNPILFNNQIINVSGLYKDTIFNKNGCDSFIYLHLTVLDTFRTILWDTICANEIRIFGNQNLNKIGVYFDTIIAPNGCFDFVTLNLFVKDTSRFIIFDTICKNQPILFNSQLINSTGIFKDTFTNAIGCDSFVYLHLTVNDTPSTQLFDTICHSSFKLFNGQNLNISGSYRDTFISHLNCDSFVTLNLYVIPKVFIDKVIICEKENYLGYNKTGTYYDTFIENGCERVREIQLTVNPITFGFITEEICYHDRIYGNKPIGIFVDTLMNTNGCDSILTKEIKVKNKPLTPLNDTFFCEGESVLLQAQEGFYLYTWNDGTTKTNLLVDKPGTYNFVIMDSFRCVDFDTINVNVLPKTEVKILPIASDSYETEELFHVIADVTINDSFDNGRFKWMSNTNLTCDTCNKTSFKLEDQNWIKVTYTNLYQCRSMDSIFFEVAPEPEYIADFPNAFSPNNDTRNDVFGPQTKNVTSIKWNIFNRWGELLFEAQSRTETWDGTYKGIPQENGLYIYTGEVEFKNSVKKQLKGEIYLIR